MAMAHKARKFFRPFFCHFIPGLLFRPFPTWSPRVPWRIKRENLFGYWGSFAPPGKLRFPHFLPIWLLGELCSPGEASLPPLSTLYIMVKRERPCTTPCLFKAHLPTAHLHGLIRTSTRIPHFHDCPVSTQGCPSYVQQRGHDECDY